MNPTSPLFHLLLEYKEGLISRDFVIDYFGDAPLMTEDEACRAKVIRPGKLMLHHGEPYVVLAASSNSKPTAAKPIKLPKDYKLSFYNRFTLETGMIANYTGKPVETTLGVFLLNFVALVKPFGNVIPYVNGLWNVSKVEDKIAEAVIAKTLTPHQALEYVNYVYSLSSLNDLCVPALSEKAITSNPEVNTLRAQLFDKHKDELTDPNVMMDIEDQLINLDKKLLEGDISNGFMIQAKNYNVHRKRMFLTLGLVESFGDEKPGYTFVKANLNEGWDTKEMDTLANDVRRGSYDRAKSTALGGAESKMLGRNFQDSQIVEEDCKTPRGLEVTLTPQNAKSFLHRNIIVGNDTINLSEANIDKYVGKTVSVRSPMYCRSKDGYCYACMDTRFKNINVKLLNIYPIGIGSAILSAAMASMHGKKLALLNIDDLNSLVV